MKSFILPITQQSVVAAATSLGSVLLYDMRSRQPIISDRCGLSSQFGEITAMSSGSDPYLLTFGTLGGFVVGYDLRLGLVSSLFTNKLGAPVVAMASRFNRKRLCSSVVVSVAGDQPGLCEIPLEDDYKSTALTKFAPENLPLF